MRCDKTRPWLQAGLAQLQSGLFGEPAGRVAVRQRDGEPVRHPVAQNRPHCR